MLLLAVVYIATTVHGVASAETVDPHTSTGCSDDGYTVGTLMPLHVSFFDPRADDDGKVWTLFYANLTRNLRKEALRPTFVGLRARACLCSAAKAMCSSSNPNDWCFYAETEVFSLSTYEASSQ